MYGARRACAIFYCVSVAMMNTAWAADPPAAANPTATDTAAELRRLKAQLNEQQKQIEQLRTMLDAENQLLDKMSAAADTAQHVTPRNLGQIASTTPMLPPAPAPSAAGPTPNPAYNPPLPQASADAPAAPPQLRVGNATIMPVGFMDLTSSWKDKDAGGSLGSNFGSVPYNNATASKLSEFRFSPQNSRLGFRVDGDWKGAHFIGYNEFDFLGTSGTFNLSVTNGAFVPRVRLYWVDVRKGKFETLVGQSWSMLTPNRKGISALPSDLFYSQVIDVNYMAGLTWTRQPGVRFLYHPSEKVTMGVSFENPNAYIGGSAGGSSIVLPAAFSATGTAPLGGTQLDNATTVQSTPNVNPDIIAKIAFDPSAKAHIEVAGIERTFKIWNPLNNQYSTKVGGGGSINANFEVIKNLRLVTNNYWSDGGGRYLFGQAPDVAVRADGTLSPIHSGSTLDGFEATIKNVLLYAYYGGIYVGRNVVVDANGSLVGYGYRGSSNSQNRAIQEISFGFNQTLWKDARYGALNFMGQYEYLLRSPWYWAAGVAGGKGTHDNTIYFNFRYTLPGSAPPAKAAEK